MEPEQHTGMRLKDRTEYKTKPRPLTMTEDRTIAEAVAEMCERNYGSIVIVDENDLVTGVFSERDVMRKIVNQGRDPKQTRLGDVMTREPRVAREDDDVVDWLRIMSNERFRRLPVVDAQGRIKAVFTQGDFVSYTWPDLMRQGFQMGRATISRNYPILLVAGGVALYSLLMVIVIAFLI